MWRRLAMILLVALWPAAMWGASPAMNKDMVPDQDTAIKVASVILSTYMGPGKFEAAVAHAPLRAKDTGASWTVYSFAGDGTVGGGGPEVVIAKHDARVLSLHFQR